MQKTIFLLLLLLAEGSFGQIKIGNKAPDISITNWIQKQPQNTFLKDKFIVIDFWATWCAPCLASMTHMNKLVEENETKSNLIFLAMTDEKKEKISRILSRVSFKASVVTDTTQQTQIKFQISSIPSCVILDDKGFIRWTGNPEQLTNKIIQNILVRKDVNVINNEETTPADIKKQYDSLRSTYRSVFDDNNIKEYFSLAPFLTQGYGSKYNYKSSSSLRKVEIGVKLKDIISEQISISSSQISLPTDVDGAYASYCYKSDKELKNEDILSSILTSARLSYNKTDSVQKVLLFEVLDSNLLSRNFQKNGAGEVSHLSVSDDGSFISMGNSSMTSIISALQDRFNCPIILKDFCLADKLLDMMLQTNNLRTFKKSMKMYGIGVKELKQVLPFVSVVHK